jgi:hypothetical protein
MKSSRVIGGVNVQCFGDRLTFKPPDDGHRMCIRKVGYYTLTERSSLRAVAVKASNHTYSELSLFLYYSLYNLYRSQTHNNINVFTINAF